MRKSSNPKRRRHQAVESASAVLMKHLLEEEKNEKEKDDIDLFFDTMKARVKKFNAGNELLTKQRVFGVISELEEFNLNQLAHSSSVTNVHQHAKPTYLQPTNNSQLNNQDVHNASPQYSPASSNQTTGSYLEAFFPPENFA
ncbi:unnamed protein product [Diabrotica balteata]|uniref:BESS domain-containing protein n=1 Tax=Diabrotica balteata TaxID=107213 RepID=A0A9N9T8B6_DIABA|nr:unnamed protein product [Diabrotica balteata]